MSGSGHRRSLGEFAICDIVSPKRSQSFGMLSKSKSRSYAQLTKIYAQSTLSHDAMIRVYNESGNVIQPNDYKGDFKEW